MKILRLILLAVILTAGKLPAQFPEVILEKDFNNSPLTELLQYAATEYRVPLFYLNRWTDTVFVIQKSKNAMLEEVIRETLAKSQLNYFIDDQRNIIFSHQYKIESELPAELLNIYKEKPRTSRVLDESSFIKRGQISSAANGQSEDRITIGTPGNLSRNSEAVISGNIREKESGQPILGAVVYVNDLGLGTTTDAYGYYVISVPPGSHELLFKYLGRKDAVIRVLVNGNGKLDVDLEEQLIELRGVVITADKEQNVKGLQLGLDKMDIQTLKQIPTSLGEVDVIKSTLLLPGVQTVGEGASGFNVRGGNTDQNLILMDGAPLFNSSHMFGFFSVFNPDIVKEFKLYKSGIPAQFGGRLSSVLDVSVRNGNLKKVSLAGGISPIAARLSLDGPIIKDKATFLLSARGSYSDWVLRRFDVKALKSSSASFYDVNAKLNYEINDNNEISLSAYYSEDHFKLNYDTTYNYRNNS